MITKREFIDRIIRKIIDYRSIAGSKLYYKEISDENEVIAAIPLEEAIYLKKYTTSGYASGLGPDNLESELKLISQAAQNNNIWIDMESNIRSDTWLDLDKCQNCAQIVNEFNNQLLW